MDPYTSETGPLGRAVEVSRSLAEGEFPTKYTLYEEFSCF